MRNFALGGKKIAIGCAADQGIRAHTFSMAVDLNPLVFKCASARDLKYRQERRPEVAFSDISDYQKAP